MALAPVAFTGLCHTSERDPCSTVPIVKLMLVYFCSQGSKRGGRDLVALRG
jgi:hypothetical protein